MKPIRVSPALATAALVAAFLVAGCSNNNNPTAPTTGVSQANADDLALQAAGVLGSGAAVDLGASATSGGATGSAAPSLYRDGVVRMAGRAAAAETTFTIGSVTYTLTRTFYDAANNPLPGYDTTAVRLVVTSRATGEVQTLRYQAMIGHEGSWEVTGLEAAQDTLGLQGACADTAQAQFTSLDLTRTRYFRWISSLTVSDVRLLKNRSVNPYPLSGTATFTVDAVRYRTNAYTDVDATLNGTVVVTFNGTAQPDVVVNGTFHYKFDLATGAVVRI